MPLFYYNVAVTLLYLYNSIVSIQRERYLFIYVTSVKEKLWKKNYKIPVKFLEESMKGVINYDLLSKVEEKMEERESVPGAGRIGHM